MGVTTPDKGSQMWRLNEWNTGWMAMCAAVLLAGGLVACTVDAPVEDDNDQDVDVGQQETDDADETGDDGDADGGDEEDVGDDSDTSGDRDAGVDDEADTGDDSDTGGAEPDADDDSNGDNGDDPLEGDTCETAIDVTDGGMWEDESTLEMNDQYDPSFEDDCPTFLASDRDRVYFVAPEETTTYEVSVEPDSDDFSTLLYVRQDCEAEACLAGTTFPTLTFDAEGGVESFIIVDGQAGHSGDFDLEVTIIDE